MFYRRSALDKRHLCQQPQDPPRRAQGLRPHLHPHRGICLLRQKTALFDICGGHTGGLRGREERSRGQRRTRRAHLHSEQCVLPHRTRRFRGDRGRQRRGEIHASRLHERAQTRDGRRDILRHQQLLREYPQLQGSHGLCAAARHHARRSAARGGAVLHRAPKDEDFHEKGRGHEPRARSHPRCPSHGQRAGQDILSFGRTAQARVHRHGTARRSQGHLPRRADQRTVSRPRP